MTKLELEKILKDKLVIAKEDCKSMTGHKDDIYEFGKLTGKILAYDEILDLLDDLWVIDY